ncbi:MAG TPA: hypothetical protein VGI86_20450 [Acidimicrobiia bacterium]
MPARALVAVAGIALLLPIVAAYHRSRHAQPNTLPQTASAASGVTSPLPTATAQPSPVTVATLRGFTLPGPVGTAPRQWGSDTIVAVDPSAAALVTSDFAKEAAAFVDYVDRYGRSDDLVAFGSGTALRSPTATRGLVHMASGEPPPEGNPTTTGAHAVTAYQVHADHDHALVVVTDSMGTWTGALSHFGIDTGNVAGRRRLYVVQIDPGSGAKPQAPSSNDVGPAVLHVDPAVPGALATALAMAWVDTTRAMWAQQ